MRQSTVVRSFSFANLTSTFDNLAWVVPRGRIVGRTGIVFLALLLAGGAGEAVGSSITYSLVDMPAYQNGSILGGYITTDGTLGNIVASDILAWSVTVSKDGHSDNISTISYGATVQIDGYLTATSSELFLPIPPTTQGTGNFMEIIGDGHGIFWNDYNADGAWQYFTNIGDGWVSYAPGLGHPLVVAGTAVPEPSTVLILGIGAVGVLGISLKRK